MTGDLPPQPGPALSGCGGIVIVVAITLIGIAALGAAVWWLMQDLG